MREKKRDEARTPKDRRIDSRKAAREDRSKRGHTDDQGY